VTPATRGLDVFEGSGFENGLKGRKLMRRVLVQLKLKLEREGGLGKAKVRPRVCLVGARCSDCVCRGHFKGPSHTSPETNDRQKGCRNPNKWCWF